MPLSTSDSKRRAAWMLLAGCAGVMLAVEAGARIGFDRVSKIQHRMADEYRTARTIGSDDACGQRHVLVVGNSLLLEDVEFDKVRAALHGGWDARRYVVEQTYYRDWYYGLRRLFQEGARPDVVVVMMSALQWIRPDTRGAYTAHYLISFTDLPAASRELGLNATETTDLFLSNVSKFWGARAELRNYVLKKLLPDLGSFMDLSTIVNDQHYTPEQIAGWVRPRLERLKAITDAHGAQLLVVLPTIVDPLDGASGVVRAAESVGVAAVNPVPPGTFGADLYRDAGFHLNPAGAAAFTARLIPALRGELAAGARASRGR